MPKMKNAIDKTKPFKPVRIAVLVVSDTRTFDDDTSGALLAERVVAAGHELAMRKIVRDEIPLVRAQVKEWIDAPDIDVVISSGGTGLTGRDITPEAITPLFEKTIEAKITSATELNEHQITQLKEKLVAKLGRQVEISVEINTDLLGGLIIQAEDLVIDGSVRGQLTKLSDTLNV